MTTMNPRVHWRRKKCTTWRGAGGGSGGGNVPISIDWAISKGSFTQFTLLIKHFTLYFVLKCIEQLKVIAPEKSWAKTLPPSICTEKRYKIMDEL